ncbi:PfkB family carbohydrate kinase, partial [Streptomyces bobili]|uniref:PfkB family carbohydrate kinase n=1 Tax=Streptomyces bobili TaxID=67280 RepID=UPI0033F53544
MTDVLTFGEAMVSLRADQPIRTGGSLRMSVAGAEANVAIGLARLGHQVRWVGLTGADQFGALVLRAVSCGQGRTCGSASRLLRGRRAEGVCVPDA